VNDLSRQKLKELIDTYGVALCDDPKRCEALLRDLCGEARREISVLVSALREGVASELLSFYKSTPREVLLSRLTRQLHESLALTEEAARWAVEAWAEALGIRVTSANLSDSQFDSARFSQPSQPSSQPTSQPPVAGESGAGNFFNPQPLYQPPEPTQYHMPPASSEQGITGQGIGKGSESGTRNSLVQGLAEFWTDQEGKPSFKLIVAGISVVVVGAIAGLFYLYQSEQLLKAKLAVQEAEEFQEKSKFTDCIERAESVPEGYEKQYLEAQVVLNACRLGSAKKLLADGEFKTAIATAEEIPENSTQRKAAKALIEEASGRKLWIYNKCPHPVTIVLNYRDPEQDYKWISEGWWVFKPDESYYPSNNQDQKIKVVAPIYIYGESTDSSRLSWTGDRAVSFKGETLKMQKVNIGLDKDGNYSTNITCSN
jgi:hypothetical protein